MQTYDNFLGRLLASTAAATDTYAEIEVTLPSIVSATASTKNPTLYIPVIKQVDFHFYSNGMQALSADCQLSAYLMLGPASGYSGLPTAGIADPNCIAGWNFVLPLTTSGQPLVETIKSIIIPGDGLIVTASALTMMQYNASTGVSMILDGRIWYDFVVMDEMTYMRALHGMSV